jgi:Zn-dependent peptidase ImmA (M78 family)
MVNVAKISKTPKIRPAVPVDLEKDQINDLAESLSRKSGYLKHRNIFDTAREWGGKIELVDFWENDSTGSLIVESLGNFVIKIPTHTTLERDRFTVAHELGHYFLHYLLPGDEGRMVADRYGGGLVEWQANWFAASFLMPTKEFKAAFKKSDSSVFSVAKNFHVSIAAAFTRAKALRLG